MNILVLGSGGREHALTWALAKSPKCETLYVAPGNGGTSAIATNVAGLDAEDGQAVLAFAKENNIELVVIGPEAPLVKGVADVLRAENIAVFGPDEYGAQLEGSKTFSKEFMIANDIPTARYQSFTDKESARAYCEELGGAMVVKADGLAAGKGVIVAQNLQEALDGVDLCFDGNFGEAGSRVVIEEMLTGPECSLLAFVSGGKAFCMAPAQDHKRAYDGDLGPNTGGMGVYSPVPIVTEEEMAEMVRVMEVAAAATAKDPFPIDYRGCLYGGFMLTPEGPKVLEFNARFGDPETQVVLSRLQSDLVDIMMDVALGKPEDIKLEWSDQWAVSVVLASQGYPGSYEKGKVITGVDEANAMENVIVFHAGTKVEDGQLLTSGGRVLNVVGMADTFEAARNKAYEALEVINFDGKQYRTDIAKKAMEGRSAWE